MTSKKLILGLLLAITITFTLTSNNAFADSTGEQSPTIAATSPASISQFVSDTNAFASDNVRATAIIIGSDQAYGAFGFDLSIPTGSTINGITVSLEGRRSLLPCGAIFGDPKFSVQLSDPTLIGNPTGIGSFVGDIKTTTDYGPVTDSIKLLGSPTDTWSNTYTDLNNFWILITTECGTLLTNMQLDHVTVNVDYTLPRRGSDDDCTNCTQPSIGMTERGQRVVDDGITVNGNTMDANYYFTDFPLVQANIGEQITMFFVIWDDKSDNIAHVEVGLGKGKIGESFAQIESSMIWDRHIMTKVETISFDETAFTDVTMEMVGKTDCRQASNDYSCDLFKVEFTPVKAIVGDVVFGISIWDDRRNAMTTFFNEGLQIGTEADIIPEVEFVAPEGTGNRPIPTDDGLGDVDNRNSEAFQMKLQWHTENMEQIAKNLGY